MEREHLPRALTAAGVGLLVGLVTLLLTNLLARANRSVAALLFERSDAPTPSGY